VADDLAAAAFRRANAVRASAPVAVRPFAARASAATHIVQVSDVARRVGAGAGALQEDDDDGFGVPGSELDFQALATGDQVVEGTGMTMSEFAVKALLYGTLLAVAGTSGVALGVAWWLDAWTLMDVSDQLFVVLPRAREAIESGLGGGLRAASDSLRSVAPQLGPDLSGSAASGGPLMPDLPRADARVLEATGREWDELEEECTALQELRRQQMTDRGLVVPDGVTLPPRARS